MLLYYVFLYIKNKYQTQCMFNIETIWNNLYLIPLEGGLNKVRIGFPIKLSHKIILSGLKIIFMLYKKVIFILWVISRLINLRFVFYKTPEIC